jgi:hypothetical protein
MRIPREQIITDLRALPNTFTNRVRLEDHNTRTFKKHLNNPKRLDRIMRAILDERTPLNLVRISKGNQKVKNEFTKKILSGAIVYVPETKQFLNADAGYRPVRNIKEQNMATIGFGTLNHRRTGTKSDGQWSLKARRVRSMRFRKGETPMMNFYARVSRGRSYMPSNMTEIPNLLKPLVELSSHIGRRRVKQGLRYVRTGSKGEFLENVAPLMERHRQKMMRTLIPGIQKIQNHIHATHPELARATGLAD